MMLLTLDSTHINHIWCKPKLTFHSLSFLPRCSQCKDYNCAWVPYTLPHSIHIQSHQSAYLYIPIILYHCINFWTSMKFLLFMTSLYYKYITISLSHLLHLMKLGTKGSKTGVHLRLDVTQNGVHLNLQWSQIQTE